MSFINGLIGLGTHLTDGILVQPPGSAGYAPAPFAVDAIISGVGANNAAVMWGPASIDWGTMQYLNLQDLQGNQIFAQPLATPFAVTAAGNNLVQILAGGLLLTLGPAWAGDLLRLSSGGLIILSTGEPARVSS